jgi:hypothetical protein
MQLSLAAGGGVLTVYGANLQHAIGLLFEAGVGIAASPPSVSPDGSTLTTTVTVSATTPIGFVAVKVSTPSAETAVSATSVLEIVP